MANTKILIAEDSRNLAEAMKGLLDQCGYETEIAYDGVQALSRLFETDFDLLVTERGLSRISGDEAALKAKEKFPDILILGIQSERLNENPIYDETLEKPFAGQRLSTAIRLTLFLKEDKRWENLGLEKKGGKLRRRDAEVKMRATEAAILDALDKNGGHAGYDEIAAATDLDFGKTRAKIIRLNDKLSAVGCPNKISFGAEGYFMEGIQ